MDLIPYIISEKDISELVAGVNKTNTELGIDNAANVLINADTADDILAYVNENPAIVDKLGEPFVKYLHSVLYTVKLNTTEYKELKSLSTTMDAQNFYATDPEKFTRYHGYLTEVVDNIQYCITQDVEFNTDVFNTLCKNSGKVGKRIKDNRALFRDLNLNPIPIHICESWVVIKNSYDYLLHCLKYNVTGGYRYV